VDVLYKSIRAEFLANNALVTALSGGLHTEVAPDAPTMPYGVVKMPSVRPDNTFTELGELALVQFNLFDNSSHAAVITDLFEKLKSCFDEADMIVTGYNHVYLLREAAFPIHLDDVWQYSVRYRWFIQKSR
jgi:hypothetical protein